MMYNFKKDKVSQFINFTYALYCFRIRNCLPWKRIVALAAILSISCSSVSAMGIKLVETCTERWETISDPDHLLHYFYVSFLLIHSQGVPRYFNENNAETKRYYLKNMYFHSLFYQYELNKDLYVGHKRKYTDIDQYNTARSVIKDVFGKDFDFEKLFQCVESSTRNGCIEKLRLSAGVVDLPEFLSFLQARLKDRGVVVPTCNFVRY